MQHRSKRRHKRKLVSEKTGNQQWRLLSKIRPVRGWEMDSSHPHRHGSDWMPNHRTFVNLLLLLRAVPFSRQIDYILMRFCKLFSFHHIHVYLTAPHLMYAVTFINQSHDSTCSFGHLLYSFSDTLCTEYYVSCIKFRLTSQPLRVLLDTKSGQSFLNMIKWSDGRKTCELKGEKFPLEGITQEIEPLKVSRAEHVLYTWE